MRLRILILILALLYLNFQIVAGAENEYGIVKAWFNGENATVTGANLRINEPVEVRVEVTSKIKGDVLITIRETGTTQAFNVVSGPSKLDVRIENIKIESGWTNTYIWKLIPNGAWKNGNAPINIVVEFYKGMNNKIIQFTIANPYILDEQYSGAVPTPVATASPAGTASKEAPFLSVIFTVGALMLAWSWRREKS